MELASLIKPGRELAVRVGERELSFVELDESSSRVAALLHERGVAPGDHVGVMLGDVVELAGIYYGVLRAGAVVVPIDTAATALEVGSLLERSRAKVVFAWHESIDAAESGARFAGSDYIVVHPASFGALLDDVSRGPENEIERQPGDLAVVLYRTAAVELTHAQLADRGMPLTIEEEGTC